MTVLMLRVRKRSAVIHVKRYAVEELALAIRQAVDYTASHMKLYLVHCGYYDSQIGDGIYENHINFFVCAENFDEARLKAKNLAEYREKRMHIDGLQEIKVVSGYRVNLELDASLGDATQIISHKHRELAPASSPMKTPPA